jgi:hypothetical protein
MATATTLTFTAKAGRIGYRGTSPVVDASVVVAGIGRIGYRGTSVVFNATALAYGIGRIGYRGTGMVVATSPVPAYGRCGVRGVASVQAATVFVPPGSPVPLRVYLPAGQGSVAGSRAGEGRAPGSVAGQGLGAGVV